MKKTLIFFCSLLFICAIKDDSFKDFNSKTFEKSMVCIPKGTFIFYDSSSEMNDDIKSRVKIPGRRVAVDSFYMYAHEVTNSDYRFFLADIKSRDEQLYEKMIPDTLVWRSKQAYNEPYAKYYFKHPAYSDYPVVGVTHQQAEEYCKWLTGIYMSQPKRKFKKVRFELPTLYQWEYAAIGGAKDYADFPWKGPFMRDKDDHLMADFMDLPESSLKRVPVYIKDSAGNYKEVKVIVASPMGAVSYYDQHFDIMAGDITAPAYSFHANGYGLYNMAGDVKEYIREEGITKGGGWRDPGFYLMNWVEQPYSITDEKAANDRGFRFMMEVLK